MPFMQNLQKLRDALDTAIRHKLDLSKPYDKEKTVYNYEEKQREYYYNLFKSALAGLKGSVPELNQLMVYDYSNQENVTKILELVPDLDDKDAEKLKKVITKMEFLYKQLNLPKEASSHIRLPKNIPVAVRSELLADISELERCFSSGCYRSAVMICGRILEVALFRKYFEATGLDLLEKAPGTGLGTLIAKLKEKNIELDPSLSSQIHLVNQLRVFSVHKKKEPFVPTKDQTHAIILYTIDALEKLF